jgi:hypothetical protein
MNFRSQIFAQGGKDTAMPSDPREAFELWGTQGDFEMTALRVIAPMPVVLSALIFDIQ